MLIISLLFISQWSEPVNVSNTPPGGDFGSGHGSLAIDRFHNLHFVWAECYNIPYGHPDIFYRIQQGDTFSAPINLSNSDSVSCFPKIICDRYGRIHVFWLEWISDVEAYIFWRMKEGNVWLSIDTITKNTPGVASCVSAVSDSLGVVHVVWDQCVGERIYTNVFYRYYQDNKWSSPIKLNDLPGAMNPDIAIDSKQQLHIVWQQAQVDSSTGKYIRLHDIFYRKFDGKDWSEIKNITNLPLSGSCEPKIAVDGRGYIYVVWDEYGITDNLTYTCWFNFSDGDDWAQPQIFENTSGRYSTIAVSNEGKGCIAWTWYEGGKSKFFYNSRFSKTSIIPTTNKNGFIWDLFIKKDTAFVIFSCLENDTISNSGEIYYSKCLLPEFPEIADTHYSYMTFKGKANIVYNLSAGGNVLFELYDSLGRLVKKADLGYKPKGSYVKPVSLSSFGGASGVYFYRIYTKKFETKGKLILIK